MIWDYPNFGPDEFRCKCGCGAVEMDPAFVATLQRIREEYGRAMTVTSGYRCANHPVESAKIQRGGRPGSHYTGRAADISVAGADALHLLRTALSHDEIQGVGINQKGRGKFVHLDSVIDGDLTRPHIWSY